MCFLTWKHDAQYIFKYLTIVMYVVYNITMLAGTPVESLMIPCCALSSIFIMVGFCTIGVLNPRFLLKNSVKFNYPSCLAWVMDGFYLHCAPVIFFYYQSSAKNIRAALVFYVFLVLYVAHYNAELLDIYGVSISFPHALVLCGLNAIVSLYLYDRFF